MTSWRATRRRVFERDKGICQECGQAVTTFECDHIYPRASGGDDSLENLRTLCKPCHIKATSNYAGLRSAGRKTTVQTHMGQVQKRKRPKSWRKIPSRPLPKKSDEWVKKIRERMNQERANV